MSHIHWCTGFDHGYLNRAEPYLVSLREQEPDITTIFTVDFHPGQPIRLDRIYVDYGRCLPQPKKMLQSGGWTVFAPEEWADDHVVIWTDADAVLQRRVSAAEIARLVRGTLNNGVMMARNRPEGTQKLDHESTCLFPQATPQVISQRFPGHERIGCFNSGLIAAQVGTWRRLYREYSELWPMAQKTWQHYALVQWLICYVVGRGRSFRFTELPLSFHAHGHLSLPEGVQKGEDGRWRANGEVILFAHAL